MENNNYNKFYFNPLLYEDRLSSFGKKVLNSLVNNWKADQLNICKQNTFQHRTSAQRSKRVLTFRDETYQRQAPPLISKENTSAPGYHEHVNNVIESNSAQVTTVIDLVQTFETNNNIIENNGAENVPQDTHTRSCPSTADLLNYKGQEVNKDNVNVDWDNMFDTELLPDAEITNPEIVLNQLQKQEQNQFTIQFTNEKEQIKPKAINEITRGNKHKKAKSKGLAIKDALPKKAKKVIEDTKPSYRKQTYKKAVKNWLEDVVVANKAEVEELNDNGVKANNNVGRSDIIIEKVKSKSNKKVVQAQLANKGGIMKYDKPKAEKIQNNEVNKSDEPVKLLEEDETKNKNKCTAEKDAKEKKNKPKFVAPIKSQIPVKDVEYKVILVDGHNENNETLKNIMNQDLVVTLVYSNGYCQLNNQHTEDLCEPEGILISDDEQSYYFKGIKDILQLNKEHLTSLMENNNIICYEGKAILIYLKSEFDLFIHNIEMIDTKIGGSLIDPDNPPENFSDLQKLLSFSAQFTIANECKLQKSTWYASLLKECGVNLVHLLKERHLWHVFVEIEMKLLPVIAEMERLGVKVDLLKLKSMEDILLKRMKSTESACYKAAGRTFQINSPVQVRTLIYDELRLDTKSNVKIKETLAKGAKSTSEIMLRSLVSVHPLPKLILEYRHLHKAHATFLAGIAQFVKDGIVRPTWVQTAAATGRIASNNPNLQAIPKAPFNLVMYPEDDQDECPPLQFRSVYVSREGHTLLAADFQHIECRVFAHAAGDQRLLAALRSGRDLFRVLAAEWLQNPEDEVSAAERERTKRIVYASMYGAGCNKLMDILQVTYEHARDVLASFHRTFPSLKSFGRSVVEGCMQQGGRVSTSSGRTRLLHNITSTEVALRAQAERQAVNFIVQGSAADVCKAAMVQCSEQLRARRVKHRLLLQIHDELVWELQHDTLHTAAAIIKQVMESCGLQCGLTTSLPVSLSVGRSWGEMTPYTIQ